MSYGYSCQNCGLIEQAHTEKSPIKSVTICDSCRAVFDDEKRLGGAPPDWYTVELEERDEKAPWIPPKHYCSMGCLKNGVSGL